MRIHDKRKNQIPFRMDKKLISRYVTPFRVLYTGVAIYTLRHSAIGFSTLEPDAKMAWAILAALVIDIGMLLAAEKVREQRSNWMITGLLISCVISAFSQLLFAVTNASNATVAPGAMWMEKVAIFLIQWRVILLPLAMPVLVVVYAFASKEQEIKQPGKVEIINVVAEPTQVVEPEKARGSKADQVRAIANLHPEWSQEEIAKRVPCAISTVSRALSNAEVSLVVADSNNGWHK